MVLSNCMFHEGSSVVHVCIDDLAAGPLFLSEWLLVDVHDLVPSSHKVVLVECLVEVGHNVADNILVSDVRVVDRLKSFSHGFDSLLL